MSFFEFPFLFGDIPSVLPGEQGQKKRLIKWREK